MFAKVFSGCVYGIEGKIIEVEADISSGLPQTSIVGLPDSAIREAVERVRAAIKNSSFSYPLQRITINLAPADLRKEGSAFDLAIAIALLTASGQINNIELPRTLIIGELSLDGTVRPVPGVLAMAMAAKEAGFRHMILPRDNVKEASLLSGMKLMPIRTLTDILYSQFENRINAIHLAPHISKTNDCCLSEIHGQHTAKRALSIAAAGRHNILLVGPPGTGKTMLARRLPSILPPLADEEALEVMKIYSVCGRLGDFQHPSRSRPFRAPHHSITPSGLIGGGGNPRPGEVSLAHRGVLFLDELSEFRRETLEALRQPLEENHVAIGRMRGSYTFPANFLLVAAMNPCPCGHHGAAEQGGKACVCSPLQISRYLSKISGPLLDRIDLQVEVPPVPFEQLINAKQQPRSEGFHSAILRAGEIQKNRYSSMKITANSQLSRNELRRFCAIDDKTTKRFELYYQAMKLSVRAHDRVMKIARTIADLESSERICEEHLAEALQYRFLDRAYT